MLQLAHGIKNDNFVQYVKIPVYRTTRKAYPNTFFWDRWAASCLQKAYKAYQKHPLGIGKSPVPSYGSQNYSDQRICFLTDNSIW